MFTHINGYLNRVGYLHLHIYNVAISTNDIRLISVTFVHVWQYRVRMYACLAAMPTTQSTNTYTTRSLTQTYDSTFGDLFYYLRIILLFGIADLTRPQLPKCNNHLVSFIKVAVYPSHTLLTFLTPLNQELWSIFYALLTFLSSLNQERWFSATYSWWHFFIFSSRILSQRLVYLVPPR